MLTVWDCALVLRGLADLGLERDAPPPGDDPAGAPARRLPRALLWRSLNGIPEGGLELLERILQVKSDQAELCLGLAWLRLAGPAGLRDARKGLALAERAVRLAPDDPLALSTQGVAYYRLGRFPEALAALTHADQMGRAAAEGAFPA